MAYPAVGVFASRTRNGTINFRVRRHLTIAWPPRPTNAVFISSSLVSNIVANRAYERARVLFVQ
jgi:hypothetical protein